jgi:hypothetical protein
VQTLQLQFRNEEGALFTLSLGFPRQDLEAAEVTTVMDAIINGDIFHTSGGAITDKVSARLVLREVEEIISYI